MTPDLFNADEGAASTAPAPEVVADLEITDSHADGTEPKSADDEKPKPKRKAEPKKKTELKKAEPRGIIYVEAGKTYLRAELDEEPTDGAMRFAKEAGEDLPAALAALVRADVAARNKRRKTLEAKMEGLRKQMVKEAAAEFTPSKPAGSIKKKVERKEGEKQGTNPSKATE